MIQTEKPPRYQSVNNIPHGWEVVDMEAIPPRTFLVGLDLHNADRAVTELNKLCNDTLGAHTVGEAMLADCRRQAEKQLRFVQDRLQNDRYLFANILSSILTEPQLDARPQCLHGLSIREAWVSWSAGFSPTDKMDPSKRVTMREVRTMLVRVRDAVEVLDGTTIENEKLVDDFRSLMVRLGLAQ